MLFLGLNDQYTYAKAVTVETNHQPLEAIVRKPLHLAPKHLERLLLRAMAYHPIIRYKKVLNYTLQMRCHMPHYQMIALKIVWEITNSS